MTSYISPSRVTCVPGYASTTTCRIGIYTFFDPTSDLVTVLVNGTTYVSGTDFTLVQRGTDNAPTYDQACWSVDLTITGLTEFTQYSWSIQQSVSGTSYSDSGEFRTAPGVNDDFAFFFASCDSNTGPASSKKDDSGAWKHYKQYVDSTDALPVAGVFYIDDYSYVDNCKINDSEGTGLDLTNESPLTQLKEFHYTAAWMNAFGMCGTGVDDAVDILWANEENRAWFRKNTNLWFQYGDHEFNNDTGWDSVISEDPTPTVFHATYTTGVGNYDGAGIVGFNTMLGLTQPPLIKDNGGSDSNAQHWVISIGCVTLAAPDFITNCLGSDNTLTEKYSSDTLPTFDVLGNNQIDDLLSDINSNGSAFTIFGNANSLKAPVTTYVGGLSESGSGCQHPLYDYNNAEYARLFTGSTPSSIMDNPITSGASGTTLHLHGDYHNPHVYKIAADTDVMYEIGIGTINGSTHFSATGLSSGDDKGGIEIEYLASADTDWSDAGGTESFHGVRVEVYGSRSPKELHVTMTNTSGATAWSKKFVQHKGGNFAWDLDKVFAKTAASVNGMQD